MPMTMADLSVFDVAQASAVFGLHFTAIVAIVIVNLIFIETEECTKNYIGANMRYHNVCL